MPTDVIGEALDRLRERHVDNRDGVLADYIPELAKADPAWFGIGLCTVDGAVHGSGDVGQTFTIQSVSKPFVYALALADHGSEAILRRIGVEPSGDAFNSIQLDPADRPHNPMVNAGAIATVGLVRASTPAERFERVLDVLSAFAGRPLEVDESVYESEKETGHRNRAIVHLIRQVGAIDGDPEGVLDVYFRQCSVLVTATDVAVMAATLANDGINPRTGQRVVDGSAVGDVLSVMYSAGMYDYSGEWAHRTGLPAKSGVSGGIAALIPGQVGVGVFSPPVDDRGNSVRGVAVCEDLSARLGLHLFRSRPRTLPPLRSVATGVERRSLRVWPHREAELLERHGGRVLVVEAQGPWSFVACARLFAVVEEHEPDHLVVEVSRVGTVDGAAATLMREFLASAAAAGTDVVVAGSGRDPFDGAAKRFPSLDAALEWCEARVLESVGRGAVQATGVVPLAESDLGRGLPPAQLAALERIGERRLVDPAEPITRAGDAASSLLLVLSGHLTALVDGRRVAAFGPGSLIGEMGFLTGAPRSATVRADETCVVMEFPSFDGLEPALVAELHRRLGVILAGRLAAATRSAG